MEFKPNHSEDKNEDSDTNVTMAVIDKIFSSEFLDEIKRESRSTDEIPENDSESEKNEISIKSPDEQEASGENGFGICPSNGDTKETEKTSSKSIVKNLSLANQILFDGKFFALKRRNHNSLTGICRICKPHTDVKGFASNPANFRSHLKRIHGNSIAEALDKHICMKRARLEKNNNHHGNRGGGVVIDIQTNQLACDGISKTPVATPPTSSWIVPITNVNDLSRTSQILFDGTFFDLKQVKNNVVNAICKVCTPPKAITAIANKTSNFRTHIRKTHGDSAIKELDSHIALRKNQIMSKNYHQIPSSSKDDNNDVGTSRTEASLSPDHDNVDPLSYDSSTKNLSLTHQLLFDGRFFELKSSDGKVFTATCKVCTPHSVVRGSSSSNFRTHLKKCHGDSIIQELNNHMSIKKFRLWRNHKDHNEIQTNLLSSSSSSIDQNDQQNIELMKKGLSLTYLILFDGKFFTLKSRNDRDVIASCMICNQPNDVKGNLNGTSNFRSHLLKSHGKAFIDELNKHMYAEKYGVQKTFNEGEEIQTNILSSSTPCELSQLKLSPTTTSPSYAENVKKLEQPNETYGDNQEDSSAFQNDEEVPKSARIDNSACLTNQILFDGNFFCLKRRISFYSSDSDKIMIGTCKLCQPNKDVKGKSSADFRAHIKNKHGVSVFKELNEYIDLESSRLEDKLKTTNSPIPSIAKATSSWPSETTPKQTAMNSVQTTPQIPTSTWTPESQPNLTTASTPMDVDQTTPQIPTTTWTAPSLSTSTSMETVEQTTFTPINASPSPLTMEKSLSNQILNFNNRVFNYFLASSTPLKAVECPEFWNMINYSDVKMPRISEEYLIQQVKTKFQELKSKIITLLEDVQFVCTTTDLWSSGNHNYLAVTCHWIDEVTFKRRSVALACKRFANFVKPNHPDDQVNMEQIFRSYNVPPNKITTNVTQNCYNFSQIFKDLNINLKAYSDNIIDENSSSVVFETINLQYICYTKTLSNIATIDIPNVINSEPSVKAINDSTLKKTFLFISLASSNPALPSMLSDLKKPNISKWNSIYDSIAYVLNLEQKHSLVELFEFVHVEPFTAEEDKYIREYVKYLQPLATAFERLQSEHGTYQGFILPTLLEMRKKCEKLLETNDISICRPILMTILDKSVTRFEEFFKSSPQFECVTTASLSHPFFKEKWVSAFGGLQKTQLRSLFVEAVEAENCNSNNMEDDDQLANYNEQVDDFYFGEEDPTDKIKGRLTVGLEALRYLGDERRNLEMLNNYPAVKQIFLKYNTALSSSQPVEHLFPYETRQAISQYSCLENELFEERVLLQVNKDI